MNVNKLLGKTFTENEKVVIEYSSSGPYLGLYSMNPKIGFAAESDYVNRGTNFEQTSIRSSQ